jgi:precorrin-3B synthase
VSAAKGWCPGALRPMESGDGLLVRLRLSGGELPPALGARIAEWARTYGNALLDLSARGNLQIRGVKPETLEPLVERLAACGRIDASPEAEAVRNVLVSPFAGFFPGTPDVRAMARGLEAALREDRALWLLPSKFGFSVDAGEYPLGDFRADIAIEATGAETCWLRLAGAEDRPLGPGGPDWAVRAALAAAALFLAAAPKLRRMRDLVAAIGVEAIAQRLGLPLGEPRPAAPARPLRDILGYHEPGFVGFGLPFGRMRAQDLADLADLAAGATLRLTPWRAILALGMRPVAQPSLPDFILSGDDPRLAIVACPGAPDCLSGSIATRDVALALAPFLLGTDGPALHVSGCAKGCACSRPTPVTLVGRDGRFDLIQEGRADAVPLLSGLSREQVVDEAARRLQAGRK